MAARFEEVSDAQGTASSSRTTTARGRSGRSTHTGPNGHVVGPGYMQSVPWGGTTPRHSGNCGLDVCAQRSNARERLAASPCSPSCLQGAPGPPNGTLTRQWEVAKWPHAPGVELMLHAWEGGYGLPDCLCCARAFALNESYTTFLCISKDDGWQL